MAKPTKRELRFDRLKAVIADREAKYRAAEAAELALNLRKNQVNAELLKLEIIASDLRAAAAAADQMLHDTMMAIVKEDNQDP